MFEGITEKEKLQLSLIQLHIKAKKEDAAHRREIKHNVDTRWAATEIFIDTWFDIKNKEYSERSNDGNRT